MLSALFAFLSFAAPGSIRVRRYGNTTSVRVHLGTIRVHVDADGMSVWTLGAAEIDYQINWKSLLPSPSPPEDPTEDPTECPEIPARFFPDLSPALFATRHHIRSRMTDRYRDRRQFVALAGLSA